MNPIQTTKEYMDVERRLLDAIQEWDDARWEGKFGTAALIELTRIRPLRSRLDDYDALMDGEVNGE